MSLFNEIETCADPDAHEPAFIEVEKHLRKRKYAGQREELVKNLPHREVQFIPSKPKVIDHYRETYECRSCRKNGTPYMEKAPVLWVYIVHGGMYNLR